MKTVAALALVAAASPVVAFTSTASSSRPAAAVRLQESKVGQCADVDRVLFSSFPDDEKTFREESLGEDVKTDSSYNILTKYYLTHC
jgi:hypothetical protein